LHILFKRIFKGTASKYEDSAHSVALLVVDWRQRGEEPIAEQWVFRVFTVLGYLEVSPKALLAVEGADHHVAQDMTIFESFWVVPNHTDVLGVQLESRVMN
jgi:hypothetical protein